MKRLTSVILVLAMLISVSACNGSKEKESASEESTSATTLATSSDSESETSMSETISPETSEEKVVEPEGLITRDLVLVDLSSEQVVLDTPDFQLMDPYVFEEEYDRIVIESDEYAYLQKAIDSSVQPYLDELSAQYNAECEKLSDMDISEIEEYFSSPHLTPYITASPLRADSMIISFEMATFDDNSLSNPWIPINISVKDEKQITLDDVVENKAALEAQIISFLKTTYYVTDLPKTFESMHRQIEDGTLRFYMYYDGIKILVTDEDDPSSDHPLDMECFIPAFSNDKILNPDYFGHVPEYYAVTSSSAEGQKDVLIWDFDGNSMPDTLSLEVLQQDDTSNPSVMKLNDTSLELTADGPFSCSFVFIQADDGQYIYAGNYCIRIESDGTLSIVSDEMDPSFTLWMSMWFPRGASVEHYTHSPHYIDVIGPCSFNRDYTFLGGNGIPTPISPYYSNGPLVRGIFYNIAPVSAETIDLDTRETSGEVQISIESVFSPVEYDPDTGFVIFYVVPESIKRTDPDNGYYIQMMYKPDAHDPDNPNPGGSLDEYIIDEVFRDYFLGEIDHNKYYG